MKNILLILSFYFLPVNLFSQLVDKVFAQVGNEIVLFSDIENQYLQYLSQGYIQKNEIRCQIIEDLLYQQLLSHHAKVDSVDVTEEDVNKELERRLSTFVSQLGSYEALEEYFGKTILEIKNDFFEIINNQLLSQRMQSTITSSVKVTPEEVKMFFQLLKNANELPIIPTQIEIAQIIKHPEIKPEEKSRIRKKLISFRDRINNGEDFKVLATLYSDDIESAKNGGELGFVSRGDLVPNFEAAAFALKGDEVSEIIETTYGYHILQLIERSDERVNVRHILLRPKVSSLALLESKKKLQKILDLINNGELEFDEAAKNHSDDPSKNNKGLLINLQTGSSTFTIEQLPSDLKYVVERMEKGDISPVSQFIMSDGVKANRIIKINEKVIEHTANLEQDYTSIYNATLANKQQKEIEDWVNKKIGLTYIRIDDISGCKTLNKWKK